MNRTAVTWIVSALAVVGLAVVGVLFGMGIMPSRTAAQGAGTEVPWFFTWGLIWTTVLIALVMAGFFIVIAMSKIRSSNV